ncbi:MAG: TRAP transporter small permease [Thermodesulfobacteriota bacterium]
MSQERVFWFGWAAAACIVAAGALGFLFQRLEGLAWSAIGVYLLFMLLAAFTGNWSRFLLFQDRGLSWFEDWTLYMAVMIGLISLFVNVALRYLFHYSLAWSEEMIREIIIYTTFIGLAPAIKNRSMITIDALVQLVPRLRQPLVYFSHLSVLLFSVIITKLGVDMAIMQEQTFQKTIIMEIPLVLLYCILPLMGATMGIRTIQVLWWDFQKNRSAAKVSG